MTDTLASAIERPGRLPRDETGANLGATSGTDRQDWSRDPSHEDGISRRGFFKSAVASLALAGGLSSLPKEAKALKDILLRYDDDKPNIVKMVNSIWDEKKFPELNWYMKALPYIGIINAEGLIIPEMPVTRNIRSNRLIPEENHTTPQYWLALRISFGDKGSKSHDNYITKGYNGVEPIEKNTGLYHFAKGLNTYSYNSRETEAHLIKAFYIAATGTSAGAEPLLDGTFETRPETIKRIEEWRIKGYDSHLDKKFLAYVAETVIDRKNIEDPNLLALTTPLLSNFQINMKNKARAETFSSANYYLIKDGKMPNYHIVAKDSSGDRLNWLSLYQHMPNR